MFTPPPPLSAKLGVKVLIHVDFRCWDTLKICFSCLNYSILKSVNRFYKYTYCVRGTFF